MNQSAPLSAAVLNPAAIAFVHDGQRIENPFLSPDRARVVDPADYGFQAVETGGGCAALDLALPAGSVIRLTDDSGCDLPALDDWQSALVGLDDAEGEEVICLRARELPGIPANPIASKA